MAWAKLDDKGCFHPKVIAAGNAAYGAWTRALQHCSGAGGDGLVTRSVQKLIDPKTKIWDRLVAVGLMDRVDDDSGDLLIHDFLDYNPGSGNSEERRAIRREAGRLGGIKSGASRRSKNEASCFDFTSSKREANAKQTRSMPTNPVPSRPVHEEEEEDATASPPMAPAAGPPRSSSSSSKTRPEPERAAEPEPGTQQAQVLAEIRRHPSLWQCDDPEFAGRIVTYAMATKPLEWILPVFAEAAAKIDPGISRGAAWSFVIGCAKRATKPKPEIAEPETPKLPELRVRHDLPGIPPRTEPESFLNFDWDGAAFGRFKIPAFALEAAEKRAAELGQLPDGYYERKARLTPKACQQSPVSTEPDTQEGAA